MISTVATSRLSGEGVFSRGASPFADFLSDTGQDNGGGDRRFPSRNFLLDEGVIDPRADSYAADGAAASHADFHAWQDRHEDYLARHVFLAQPATGAPRTLNPARAAVCPQTFLDEENLAFSEALIDLDLLRVVSARRIAILADVREPDLLGWAMDVAVRHDRDSEAWKNLDGALGVYSSCLDLRPVFSTFWLDQRDLFEPADDPDWADKLRNRLGLLHLTPSSRGEIAIFVFRYPVSSVPKHVRIRNGRPLAAPSVLDGSLCEAFCPAPKGDTLGRVLNLSGSADVPSREVVHPFLPYGAEQLFRVGIIRQALPLPLAEARIWHLLAVRDLCKRPNYAAGTDGDLLG